MSYQEDLEKLKIHDPQDEDALLKLLGISPSSPEGYYASLIFDWQTEHLTLYDHYSRMQEGLKEK